MLLGSKWEDFEPHCREHSPDFSAVNYFMKEILHYTFRFKIF